MKNNYSSIKIISLCVLLCSFLITQAQAYRKGSILISVSEGHTVANYTTNDISGNKPVLFHKECVHGDRDPLILEYAVSNRWGIGFTSGLDIFRVNSSDFYGFTTSEKNVKATTGEFTFDVNYHVLVNRRLDVSLCSSFGVFSMNIKGNDHDNAYTYTSNGNILRFGARARYYFYKRFGAFGMMSSYYASASPKDIKGNTVGRNYSTTLNGIASEIGLCYRIF